MKHFLVVINVLKNNDTKSSLHLSISTKEISPTFYPPDLPKYLLLLKVLNINQGLEMRLFEIVFPVVIYLNCQNQIQILKIFTFFRDIIASEVQTLEMGDRCQQYYTYLCLSNNFYFKFFSSPNGEFVHNAYLSMYYRRPIFDSFLSKKIQSK